VPRVSIAVPVYNVERYVAQCLESLLGQTFGDFELIISDNASTDDSEQVCRSYAARDSRIRYIRRTENIGGPGNFRYVFAQCQGEYHKWSTADDYWDKTFLAKAVAVLDARPDTVLCYPMTTLIDASGAKLSNYQDNLDLQEDLPRTRFFRLLQTIGLCNAHLGLIRRSAMKHTRLIGNEWGSDNHFLAELALYGKFSLLKEPLFYRRYHEQSSSWDRVSVEHQRQYYDPGAKGTFGFHAWRRHWHLMTSAWRSPLPLIEKLRISSELGRLAAWDRRQLTLELCSIFRAPR
jgi:glycosyltransferase involved in cell wall biosynthesis